MAEAAAAIIAGLSLAYGVYSGEEQGKQQRKGVRRQEQAQQQASARASSERRDAAMRENDANQETPDPVALLEAARRGPGGSALLTGAGGVRRSNVILGRSTLLGE